MTGADRKTSEGRVFITPPDMAAYNNLPAIVSDLMPPFSHHLEYKLAFGHPPFSQQLPHSGGWISFRNPDSQHDKAMSVALSDAWWPSYMSQINQLRAMGTVSFSAHFGDAPKLLCPILFSSSVKPATAQRATSQSTIGFGIQKDTCCSKPFNESP